MPKYLTRSMLLCVLLLPSLARGDGSPASDAINALGIDLLRSDKSTGNALISPYSIQCALGMSYAGAEGRTKEEMAAALHYLPNVSIHESFANLQKTLRNTSRSPEGGANEIPFQFIAANRLYGEKSFEFLGSFLDVVKRNYGAPLEPVDFIDDAEGTRGHINDWVETQTRDKIKNVLPPGSFTKDTRLVLVNACYFKAEWVSPFEKSKTKSRPFHLENGSDVDVKTMSATEQFGYAKEQNYTVVTLPYDGDEIHFLILMPDRGIRLSDFARSLTSDILGKAANVPSQRFGLRLPKFKIEPPLMKLSQSLIDLGMGSAFDKPKKSANFDGMARRISPDEYLYISNVFHKTFLKLDEAGTEAAAAIAIDMPGIASMPPPPVEVLIDRPFIFAIQHKKTGTCLFLGRVMNPK